MFLPNSRYVHVETVHTRSAGGGSVLALKLRRLAPASGRERQVQANDRLDLYAHEIGGDATRFWHVADANTALDSRELTAVPGDYVIVPER